MLSLKAPGGDSSELPSEPLAASVATLPEDAPPQCLVSSRPPPVCLHMAFPLTVPRVNISPFYKGESYWTRAHPNDFSSISLKTQFPNKVTFLCASEEDFSISFWRVPVPPITTLQNDWSLRILGD